MVLHPQVFADEQQRYQAFTGLLRHVSSPGLSPLEQLSVAETASRHGLALPSSLSSAALMLAVKVAAHGPVPSSPCVLGTPAPPFELLATLAGAPQGHRSTLQCPCLSEAGAPAGARSAGG